MCSPKLNITVVDSRCAAAHRVYHKTQEKTAFAQDFSCSFVSQQKQALVPALREEPEWDISVFLQ